LKIFAACANFPPHLALAPQPFDLVRQDLSAFGHAQADARKTMKIFFFAPFAFSAAKSSWSFLG
jgi:hypothetical protein